MFNRPSNYRRLNGRIMMMMALLLSVIVLLPACGGLNLAGEPDIVVTLAPQPTRIPELGYPENMPNLANGAAIFAENCTDCHGIGGQGDGGLVQSGDVPYPGDMTDWQAVSVDTPTDWYNMVTNGNLERLMPPWIDSLTEQERWDVAMYAYTLSYTDEQITTGETLFMQSCAECHGEQGHGDGTRAIEEGLEPGDLTLPQSMVTLGDEAIYTTIAEGIGEKMPAFGDDLSPEEMQTITAYTRTLSLQNADSGEAIAQAPTPTAEPEAVVGQISGTVTNGTEGGDVLDDTPISLYVFNNFFTQVDQIETTLTDGAYAFEDITLEPQFTYVAVAEHQQRRFISNPVRVVDTSDPTLELPIEIFDVTTDPDVIEIVNFAAQVSVQEDRLQVIQVISYENTSDMLFSSDEQISEEGSVFTSVQVTLPPGAIIAGFPDSPERYVVSEDGTIIQDTQPLLPGQAHNLQVVYFLPFNDDAIIEHVLDYPLNGMGRLLVSPIETRIRSEQLLDAGEAVINSAAYQEYTNGLVLPAGDVIRYEVIRAGGLNSSSFQQMLPLVLFVISGAAAGAAIALYVLGRNKPERQINRQIDRIMSQIAQLDNDHEAGNLNHDVWHQQRNELKAKLGELLKKRDEK